LKHVEIEEELHDLLKFYCWHKSLKLKEFVNDSLKGLPELKSFEKERKRMRYS